MNNLNSRIVVIALVVVGAVIGPAAASRAQGVVYSEDFETDHSNDGTWIINSVGGWTINYHKIVFFPD